MIEAAMIVGYCTGWFICAVWVSCLSYHIDPKDSFGAGVIGATIGLFWPLVLPAIVVGRLGKYFYER